MREITDVRDSVESHRLFCDGEVRDITRDEHAERDELDPWRLDAADVAAGLGTDVRRGLTFAEAAARLGRYGPNELEPEAAVPAWRKLLSQFANPLVYLLLAAVVVSVTAWVAEGAEGASSTPSSATSRKRVPSRRSPPCTAWRR
jgi:magnesium-transporting ATPase (P-type)